jgi:hypothetical protein
MMSHLRTRIAAWSGAVTVVGALLAVAPAHANLPCYLGGKWLNSNDPASSYQLVPSSDRKTLNMSWRGIGAHSGLVGTFTGTLQGQCGYRGTFHVTEGSTVVNGTGSIFPALGKTTAGYPPLEVRLSPDSGGESDITLEIFISNPEVIPNTPKAEFDLNCPGSTPCRGEDFGDNNLSNASPDVATSASAKQVIYAEARFSIKGGHSRKLVLSLNKTGRKALAKRGSLRMWIHVILTTGSGPHKTTIGVVTFHKK